MKKRTLWLLLALVCIFGLIIWTDFGGFVSAIFRNPSRVGAAAPSSGFLAKKITKNIKEPENRIEKEKPLKILEVGAGTGVFTEEIVKKMGPNDILDVIEIDSGFCDILKNKFGHNKNVSVYGVSILDFDPGYKYDFIVSGLPFNAFDFKFVSAVLEKYKSIIENNGMVSYFEYALVGAFRKLFLFGDSKVDFKKNVQVRKDFIKQYGIDRDFILINFPPAYVYHMRISIA